MKKVKKQFTRCGFYHKQVMREGNVAIFERGPLNGDSTHYELVNISSHNGYKMGNSYIEAAETYPGASLWGLQGWTYMTLGEAKKDFNLICKRFNIKEAV